MFSEIKSAFSENKLAICVSIAILLISLVLGYFLEPYLYDYFNPLVDDLTQKVQSGVIKLTFQDIFSNNFRIILQMFIYGVIFCFSAFLLAFNGFFVGYYAATNGNLFHVLIYIVPHGIFEFSSCIIACSAGFVLFNFLYKFINTLLMQENNSILEKLYNSYNESFDKLKQSFILFAVSVILMIIAGVIEVYLTLPIAEFILSF